MTAIAETRNIPLARLVPHPDNPREIGDAELAALDGSLEEFGLVSTVTWNERTGHILGGHQRVRLLREALGEEAEIPVSVVDLDSDRERVLLAQLNDQRSQGRFVAGGLDRLLAGVGEGCADLLAKVGLTGPMPTSEGVTFGFGGGVRTGAPEMSLDNLDIKWQIVVDCADEREQRLLLGRFETEGLKCRALML